LGAAVSIVQQVDSSAVRTMFDTRGGTNEKEPHAILVDRYFDLIRHIHINEAGGPYPGTGTYDFKPVLSVLRRRGYKGWLSLELSDLTVPEVKSAGPVKIATDSLRYLDGEIAKLGAS
jgi:D-psicose/D-tagatose/L-ribulose 3-epimerase